MQKLLHCSRRKLQDNTRYIKVYENYHVENNVIYTLKFTFLVWFRNKRNGTLEFNVFHFNLMAEPN